MRVIEKDNKYLVVSDRGNVLNEFSKQSDADDYVDKYSLLKQYVGEENRDPGDVRFQMLRDKFKELFGK